MRKLSLCVVIILVLSLLVAVSTPVSAGKPNPPSEKVKNVPPGQSKEKKPDKQTPPGQAKPGKPGNAGSVVAPADDPEPVENAARTVTICHKPGTPAEQTLTLPESAVGGHMRHGDSEGPCRTQGPILSPTVPITLTVTPVSPTLSLSPTAKISICHKPGTPAEKTLALPSSAIPGHLGHGDLLGSCSEGITPPTSTLPITPSLVPTSTQWISICHKPGTPAEKALVLPASAIPGHLGHGDELGSCLGATAPPSATVPVTTVVVPTSTVRILICHKPGTAAEQTLAVPAGEIPEHLAHFDTLGACEGAPSVTWATELIVALTRWIMHLFA